MMDYNVPRSERRPFSNELLAEIHIKLDKRGVEGLDEKEMMVLLTEEVSDSTDRLDNISRTTNEISMKIDHTAERLGTSIDLAAKQITIIEPIAEQVGEIHYTVKEISTKIDYLMPIIDTTQQISEKMDNLGEKMDNLGEKVDSIGEKIDGIGAKIDESVTPLKEEIIKFRRTISLSAKLIVSGLWAVFASLIAGLIFKACGG